jgi:GntR family transcriptional regulator
MELIDREDHQKLYFQLYEILKRKIESREWSIGSQIPTEEELCKLFNVSRVTVRTAVMELVRQGYLKRQQGKGTFIYKSIVSEGLTMFTNVRELLFDEGITFSANVLVRTVMMPVDDLDKKMNIPKDKHLIFIKRLWSVENEPVLLQESYIPYHLCPLLIEEELEGHSLIELLEKKYTIKITHIKTYIEVTPLNADEARLLGLTEGSFAILLNQYSYSGETLVLYTRLNKRTDRFTFFMELERR